MILKENIKAQVDKLDNYDLRVVELLIETLKRKKRPARMKPVPAAYPFHEVIKLMGNSTLSSKDIQLGRQERI